MLKHILFLLVSTSLFAFETGVKTFRLTDETRDRPVKIEVWYPIEQGKYEIVQHEWWNKNMDQVRDAEILEGKFPLIVMSHGHWGDRRDRAWIAEDLVEAGYIVASVEHHGNSWDSDDPEFFLTPWYRPQDISYAITELLNEEELSKSIDADKIGFCGFSLGGMTGIWLAGARLENLKIDSIDLSSVELPRIVLQALLEKVDFEKCTESFTDERIKSYLLHAPSVWGFDTDTFSNITAPMHIIVTSGDVVLAPESHGLFLNECLPHSELTLIDSLANHNIFLTEPSEVGKERLPEWVYEVHPSVDKYETQDYIGKVSAMFFDRSL